MKPLHVAFACSLCMLPPDSQDLLASARRPLPAFVHCRTPPEQISVPLPPYFSRLLKLLLIIIAHSDPNTPAISYLSSIEPCIHSSHAAPTIYTYNVYRYSSSPVSLYTPAPI